MLDEKRFLHLVQFFIFCLSFCVEITTFILAHTINLHDLIILEFILFC